MITSAEVILSRSLFNIFFTGLMDAHFLFFLFFFLSFFLSFLRFFLFAFLSCRLSFLRFFFFRFFRLAPTGCLARGVGRGL